MAQGQESILGMKVPGTGSVWEMGKSRGSPCAAGESHHSLLRTTLLGTEWVQPCPFPRHPHKAPVPPCPLPALAVPSPSCGSCSLPLAVFRAVPLSSPSARPIYSSGLFLGQDPGVCAQGPRGAAGTAAHALHAARLPASPPRCWRMGLCCAPGTWRLSRRAVAGLRGAQQGSMGVCGAPQGSAGLHGLPWGSARLCRPPWGSVGLSKAPWSSVGLHGPP